MNEPNFSNPKTILEWLFGYNSNKENWINYIESFNILGPELYQT